MCKKTTFYAKKLILNHYSGSNHISGPVSCFGHREMYDSKGRGEKSFFIEIAVNLLLYSLFIFFMFFNWEEVDFITTGNSQFRNRSFCLLNCEFLNYNLARNCFLCILRLKTHNLK